MDVTLKSLIFSKGSFMAQYTLIQLKTPRRVFAVICEGDGLAALANLNVTIQSAKETS